MFAKIGLTLKPSWLGMKRRLLSKYLLNILVVASQQTKYGRVSFGPRYGTVFAELFRPFHLATAILINSDMQTT